MTITIESVDRSGSDDRPGVGGRRVRRARRRLGPDGRGRPSPRWSPRPDGELPVTFVFTRLRTRPTDRWRSDPEPTMVREFERHRPADARRPKSPCGSISGRATSVLAALLGISGPQATARLTGVASARPGGRRPTTTPPPHGSPPSAAPSASSLDVDRTRWCGPVRHRPAARRLLADHRGASPRRRRVARRRRAPARGRWGEPGRRSRAAPVGGDLRLEITSIDPRSVARPALRRAGAVLPAAIAELSLGERTVRPGSCRHRLPLATSCRSTASRCRFRSWRRRPICSPATPSRPRPCGPAALEPRRTAPTG